MPRRLPHALLGAIVLPLLLAGPARAAPVLRASPHPADRPLAHAAAYMPNDPGRGTSAGGWAQDQWNFTGPYGVGALGAWQHLIDAGHPGGYGVTVAVLDTGLAYHSAFPYRRSPDVNPGQVVRGYDFVANDPRPYDVNGHGTHVASTIAEATNNGQGETGLAYGVRIMPIRVLDDTAVGDPGTIAKGIRWAADHGAQIINLSLEFDPSVRSGQLPDLMAALRYARAKGAIIVAAAGNEGEGTVSLPARAPGVIAVGATTADGCLSAYSNEGRDLDLVAPGGGDDADLPGDPRCDPTDDALPDVLQVTLTGPKRDHFGIPDDYEGTSMAAPHVAAAAALVIASGILGPHPSAANVQHRLQDTAMDLGAPGYDDSYGNGLLDAETATRPGVPVRPVPPTGATGATGPAALLPPS